MLNDPQVKAAWDIVVKCSHYDSELLKSVTIGVKAELMRAVWSKQDGYGSPGFTPAQGWDWSGIRDSSETAVLAMAIAALKVLNKHGIPLP